MAATLRTITKPETYRGTPLTNLLYKAVCLVGIILLGLAWWSIVTPWVKPLSAIPILAGYYATTVDGKRRLPAHIYPLLLSLPVFAVSAYATRRSNIFIIAAMVCVAAVAIYYLMRLPGLLPTEPHYRRLHWNNIMRGHPAWLEHPQAATGRPFDDTDYGSTSITTLDAELGVNPDWETVNPTLEAARTFGVYHPTRVYTGPAGIVIVTPILPIRQTLTFQDVDDDPDASITAQAWLYYRDEHSDTTLAGGYLSDYTGNAPGLGNFSISEKERLFKQHMLERTYRQRKALDNAGKLRSQFITDTGDAPTISPMHALHEQNLLHMIGAPLEERPTTTIVVPEKTPMPAPWGTVHLTDSTGQWRGNVIVCHPDHLVECIHSLPTYFPTQQETAAAQAIVDLCTRR